MVVSHVDNLLFTGSAVAERSLEEIGRWLGFGSVEKNDFIWRGKRICRASDGSMRISMVEYRENIAEVFAEKHRKNDPMALLNPLEARKLRAMIGSLQWLVAQCRFGMGFSISVLQGETPPTIGTLLRANLLVREFQATQQL